MNECHRSPSRPRAVGAGVSRLRPPLPPPLFARRPLPGPGANGAPVFRFSNFPLGPSFQRAWVQGVVVHASPDRARVVLDDGTGPPVEILLPPTCVVRASRASPPDHRASLDPGSYVACVGALVAPSDAEPRTGATYALEAERVHDQSDEPEREAMWNVEVLEGFDVLERARKTSLEENESRENIPGAA